MKAYINAYAVSFLQDSAPYIIKIEIPENAPVVKPHMH